MENTKRYYIFDFDSTFTQVEGLDLLGEIALSDNPDRDNIVRRISEITDKGIDGNISFSESLSSRIALLGAKSSHLSLLIEQLKAKVSESIVRYKDFFVENKDQIYILSAGFKEFIIPVVADYGIPADHVLANEFVIKEEVITGYDTENPLSKTNGKIEALKSLNLEGHVQMIGDGYSDYVTREAGVADSFVAYTENVEREKTIQNADHIVTSFEEFLFVNDLPRKESYPKNRIKILLLENIHPDAEAKLSKDGFTVETVSRSLSEDELIERLQGVHVLGVRSKTQVTRKVMESADRLMVVSAFCIGTKQIDLEAAKELGIVTFNAPYSNTRSVVELAIGEIIMLMRSVFKRSTEIHEGQWQKTAEGSREVRGKNLGIVGYGNIGKQLSILAEALGMKVYYYDVEDRLALGNAIKVNTLSELLALSDVVSLHVDDNAANKNFIGAKEIAQMKDGAHLVNLSRGFVVDIDALADALKSGKLAGAAVDVYPSEPRKNGEYSTPLQGIPNVILTPHVGGSTEEAQKDIADFVPGKIMAYINAGNTVDAVNFPNIRLPRQDKAHRFLHIHHNVPGIMAKINQVLAKYELNIIGQYLSTDSKVGYVITDVNREYDAHVIDELREVEGTIRFRVLY